MKRAISKSKRRKSISDIRQIPAVSASIVPLTGSADDKSGLQSAKLGILAAVQPGRKGGADLKPPPALASLRVLTLTDSFGAAAVLPQRYHAMVGETMAALAAFELANEIPHGFQLMFRRSPSRHGGRVLRVAVSETLYARRSEAGYSAGDCPLLWRSPARLSEELRA